jgi:hypothetical protein
MEVIAKNPVNRRLQGFKEVLKSQSAQDIFNTMKNDGCLTDADGIAIFGSQDPAEELFIRMEKSKKAGLINLLDYRWQLLPWIEVELIVVTNTGMHRYTHKEP